MKTMITGRAFLSHSHEDQPIALDLKGALERQGIETYAYENDMLFGGPLVDEIEKEIRRSDYVLVLLSDAARRSTWVSRELGLAHLLRQSSGMTHPTIIGVLAGRPLEDSVFDVLEFQSGEPTEVPPHDFSASRCFDYRPHDETALEAFVKFLLPTITFVDDEAEVDRTLLNDSFTLYEEAFEEAERDSPDDIMEWLAMARQAADEGGPWREVYAVLSVAGRAVGMSFVTAHLQRQWSFANYFTVRHEWRQLRRTEWFLHGVVNRLTSLVPGMRGIVFEIDPIDMSLLRRASSEGTIADSAERNPILTNLRALRRLNWYQSYQVRAIVGSDGEPTEYWQPAMDEAMSPENMRRLIPMVRTFDGSEVSPDDIRGLVDFLYDDLYGEAYAEGPMTREEYRAYARDTKQIVLGKLSDGARLGPIRVPDSVRALLNRVKREGVLDLKL